MGRSDYGNGWTEDKRAFIMCDNKQLSLCHSQSRTDRLIADMPFPDGLTVAVKK